MLFDDTLPLEIVTGSTTSVSKIILFLRTATQETLDFVLDQCWHSSGIIKIVPWKLTGDGVWAIHIDLKPLGRAGEEAYIPFPWRWTIKPTVSKAILAYRITEVNYND